MRRPRQSATHAAAYRLARDLCAGDAYPEDVLQLAGKIAAGMEARERAERRRIAKALRRDDREDAVLPDFMRWITVREAIACVRAPRRGR